VRAAARRRVRIELHAAAIQIAILPPLSLARFSPPMTLLRRRFFAAAIIFRHYCRRLLMIFSPPLPLDERASAPLFAIRRLPPHSRLLRRLMLAAAAQPHAAADCRRRHADAISLDAFAMLTCADADARHIAAIFLFAATPPFLIASPHAAFAATPPPSPRTVACRAVLSFHGRCRHFRLRFAAIAAAATADVA